MKELWFTSLPCRVLEVADVVDEQKRITDPTTRRTEYD